MPKGPKGQKRPADVVSNAVRVIKIATGEEAEEYDTPADQSKDAAAVSMGKRGGKARAAKLTAEERVEIARRAAAKRWEREPTN